MARHVAQNTIKRMVINGIDVARSTVGVMGVTFKDNCPDIRNSKVFDLIDEIRSWGVKVVIIDPWANSDEVYSKCGLHVSAMEFQTQVDSLVVAVAHREFVNYDIGKLRDVCRSNLPVLSDVKSIYSKSEAESAGFTVFRL
jgi:UDP-N-acetyl-D-galactosamine dehydrogenase